MIAFIALLRLVRPYWREAGLAVLMGLLTIFSGIALMMTSAFLISTAALQPPIADLQVAIVGVRFFGIGRGVFRYIERLSMHHATFQVLSRLRVWFYERIEPLAPANLEEVHSSELLERVIEDIERLQDFFVRVLAPPLIAVLTLGGMTIYFLSFDLALVGVLVAVTMIIAVGLPMAVMRIAGYMQMELMDKRSLLHRLYLDGVQGMADLLVLNGEQQYLANFDLAAKDYQFAQRHINWTSAGNIFLTTLFNHGGVVLLLVLAIPLVSSGQIGGVWLAVLAFGMQASHEAYLPLAQTAQQWPRIKLAYQRLTALFDAELPAPDKQFASLPENPRVLRFEHVSFGYHPNVAGILSDVSFDLRTGRAVAVVGPSGGGKSTLLNLMLAFWQPDSGKISIDGMDIALVDPEVLRSHLAIVEQQPHLFNGTIKENLLLAAPLASEKDIDTALLVAGLADFVRKLPKGLNTPVGEQGLLLSSGERQRLGAARAVLRSSPFLICDEPTANLDAPTGRALLAELVALKSRRAVLVITHAVQHLDLFDEIILLDKGRVIEQGSYQQLFAYKDSLLQWLNNLIL